MNIPKFKDIMQVLSVFKDYSSLLTPVVLVLVGVLVFVPTQLMSSKLKKQIAEESISKIGKKIKSLSRDTVARDQWLVEQEYQFAFASDANQVTLLARQSSQRPLLSYKIFPEPKDTSMLIFEEFGNRFRDAIDKQIIRLNARDCPTIAEIERDSQNSGRSVARNRGMGRSPVWRGSSSGVDIIIKDVLCQAKAESASVYANAIDLSGYEFWKEYEYTGMDKAVKDCWYWQLAYWIIEDVIETIDTMNSWSNTVFASPVKRLMSVGFTKDEDSYRDRTTISGEPGYVLSAENGFTGSCTDRWSNDNIDVVHFNISVVVSAKAVLPFMQQLCSAKRHKFKGWSGEEQEQIFKRNQITILRSQIKPVDMEDEVHDLYRYGEDAVIKLDLICEYIFNKNGYEEIKPESIKKPSVK